MFVAVGVNAAPWLTAGIESGVFVGLWSNAPANGVEWILDSAQADAAGRIDADQHAQRGAGPERERAQATGLRIPDGIAVSLTAPPCILRRNLLN